MEREMKERERAKSSEKEKEKGTFSCSYALQIAKWINAKVVQSRLLNKLIGISVLAYANANATPFPFPLLAGDVDEAPIAPNRLGWLAIS